MQSSQIFQERMSEINKAFSKVFNLTTIFPDGHYLIETDETTKEEKRGWMKLNNVDYTNLDFSKIKNVLSSDSVFYLGFEQSLAIIKEIALNNPEINCFFGFSQGALFMLLFTMLFVSYDDFKTWFPSLKCLVFVSGFITPKPINDEYKLVDIIGKFKNGSLKIDIPTFHVYGENDDHIVP